MTTLSTLQVGMAAPDIRVQTVDDTAISLSQVWQEQPILLFFLRHFGCALCRSHLHSIRDSYDEFRARGTEVIAMTLADTRGAAQFAHQNRLPFRVFADPLRNSYRAFTLAEGTLNDALGLDVLARQVTQALRGNMPYMTSMGSSIKQLGGSFIVDQRGTVQFAHFAIPIYNYPTIAQYLSVIDQLEAS
ncbi:MAG: peroxiredoxin-like family protein [Chloroflexota bacterium]